MMLREVTEIAEMKWLKRSFITGLVLLIIATVFAVYSYHLVERTAAGKLYNNVDSIPARKVGLLLGTSKFVQDGKWLNTYYQYRIQAAAELLRSGKIKYLVISGDNSRKEYDEPSMMRGDLVAMGIDSSRIFLDYAGFRTFDSMVRLREIFSQHEVTVISQDWHNKRAIYIGEKEGIDVIGFNPVSGIVYGSKAPAYREYFARSKAVLDETFGQSPKFLGPKVSIPE